MAEQGYLVIADITGYTKFLSQTELDHANEILESLLNTIVDHLHSPLTLAKIEGDAVFAYTTEENYIQGQTLLESLEHVYYSFAHALESSNRNTTCTCKACSHMKGLDLKIVAHHGEFGLQKIGPQIELVGNDVNLVHRLLKNNIQNETGIGAYIYFTESAAEKMHIIQYSQTMVEHSESYDHLGEVGGFVYDLVPAWQRERERRRVYVTKEQADLTVEGDLPVPSAVAWEYFNDPDSKTRYMHADNIKMSDSNRIAIGTTYHCAHGDIIIDQQIVDWQPFDYVTMNIYLPLPKMVTAPVRCTIRLTPSGENQTHVNILFTTPNADKKISQTISDLAWKTNERKAMKKRFETGLDIINEMISEDRESGRLKMKIIAAQAEEEA